MGIGEIAALMAAACWASASLLYSGTKLSAWGMNCGKNVIATTVFSLQLLVIAGWNSSAVFNAGRETWWWLAWSSVIGIVIGDTLYFRSLQILGPRKALIVSTTAPVLAAALGYAFLSEAMSVMMLTGMIMTLSGVSYVVADRRSVSEAPGLFPGSTIQGVLAGLGGAICQALGGVCSRVGMRDCDGVEGAFIRLAVSTVCVVCVLLCQRQFRQVARSLFDHSVMKTFFSAVLLGTWLGIWLSQVAYKFATVSVTTTLLATAPLFAAPLVRIVYGHSITWSAILATTVAVVGVFLIVA
jgi:drug/metabolite transporter (DMT)-like permease